MHILVSIIIPVYNRSHLISATFDSVLVQTYTNWECIIVDDGSTDQSLLIIEEFLKKDQRFKFLKRPDNRLKGANACRNYGKQIAKGEYIMFLDSDDLLSNNCLENRINYVKSNPQYDLVIFSMGHFLENNKNCYEDKNRRVVNFSIEDTIFEFALGKKLPWNVTRPFFRRATIENVYFNESIQNFQDDEFNIRVLSKSQPQYISIDVTDCYYRMDESNITKYDNFIGNQNVINSMEIYYRTIFDAFSKKSKIIKRNDLIKKLFYQINYYISPKLDLSIMKKTIKLFNSELKLTYKEQFLLLLIINLKIYYYNKKGYYKLRKILFNFLNK